VPGYELIEEIVVPAGGQATIDFDSIPATYKHLEIFTQAFTESTTPSHVHMRFNNDSGSNYYDQYARAHGTTVDALAEGAVANGGRICVATDSDSAQPARYKIVVPYYLDAFRKGAFSEGYWYYADGGYLAAEIFALLWTDNDPIDRITFFVNGGPDFQEGTTFSLYGVPATTPTDKKLSELAALATLVGTEEFLLNDGGTSKKIAADDLVPVAHGARVYRTTVQSIPNSADTLYSFTAEEYDTDGYHDNSTNPSRITIPSGRGGYYHLGASLAFAAGTGIVYPRFLKNGSAINGGQGAQPNNAGFGPHANFGTDIHLAAGDYVEVNVFQNSGGSLNVGGSSGYDYAAFWAHLIGV